MHPPVQCLLRRRPLLTRRFAASCMMFAAAMSAGAVEWRAPQPLDPIDFPTLLQLLASEDDEIASRGFETLCEAGPAAKPVLPDLLQMLEHGDRRQRVVALHLLVCIGEIAYEALPVLIRRAPNIDDPEEMVPMMGALRHFGPEVAPLRGWLLKVVEGKEIRFAKYGSLIRCQAVEILHLFDDPTVLDEMMDVLKDEKDDFAVRQKLVLILPDHMPEARRYMPYLTRALFSDPKRAINLSDLASALAKMDEYALSIFIEHLDTDDPLLKHTLLLGLRQYVRENHLDAVEGLVSQLGDPTYGYFARSYLVELECAPVGRLIPHLYDPDPLIRHETLRVLSGIGPNANEAVDELASLLCVTPDPAEQRELAMTLRMIGRPAEPYLRNIAADATLEPEVRRLAAKALESMLAARALDMQWARGGAPTDESPSQ